MHAPVTTDAASRHYTSEHGYENQCVICSACEILFWEVPSGRRVTSAQKDQCWQTWTSKVGFGVMGIWRSGDDRSDINSVSVDDFKQLVAVGDDDGTVCCLVYAAHSLAAVRAQALYLIHG